MSTPDFDEIISTNSNDDMALQEMQIARNEDQFYENHCGLVNFNMQRKIISSGQNIPSCNIGDVNIAGTPSNIHLGTKLIINGTLNIPDESEENMNEFDENDDNYEVTKKEEEEEEEDMGLEDTYTRIGGLNLGLELIKRKSYVLLNKYLLVFIAFLIIEVIFLIFYFTLTSGNKISSEITGLRLRKIGTNLRDFFPRKNDWGSDNVCTVRCPLKRKTIIRLAIPKTILITCSFVSTSQCRGELEQEYRSYRNAPKNFNDIYYNYVVGMEGSIFEARSLTCSYNEPFIREKASYHDETLVIGVSFCFPYHSRANVLKTSNERRGIENLLHSLKENNILGTDYEFQLLNVCKESLMAKELEKNYKVTFYDEDYNNVTNVMTTDAQRSLLFQNYVGKFTNIHQVSNLSYENCGNNNTRSKAITVRLLYTDQLNITFSTSCAKYIDCKNDLAKVITTHKKVVGEFTINYFAFIENPSDVYKFYPLNCSSITQNNDTLISILINRPSDYKRPENYFPPLSQLLRPISSEVQHYVPYNHVNFQFLCDKGSVSDQYSMTFYEFFSDVSYISDNLNFTSDCATSPARYLKDQSQPEPIKSVEPVKPNR